MSEQVIGRRQGAATKLDGAARPAAPDRAAVATQTREPPAAQNVIGNHGVLRRDAAGAGAPASGDDSRALVRAGLATPGHALPRAVRDDMEARVGRAGVRRTGSAAIVGTPPLSDRADPAEREARQVAHAAPAVAPPAPTSDRPDFAAVRVHTGPLADAAAGALDAEAFTVGDQIAFADGAYAPDTTSGRRLLAHELTHVVQGRAVIARQGAAAAVHVDARPADTAPAPAAIPEGGTDVGEVGVVGWDGATQARLRSAPDTSGDNVVAGLPFNARVQVIKQFPGDWYFVATESGDLGYVYSKYVRTDLPEPYAQLHRVAAGTPGTAIAIAEHYFAAVADDWGQDLRFYVATIAWLNGITIPDETDGWKQVHFQAGQLIWIPSQQFALSLKGVVNSGSRSYEVADAVGVAGVIERAGQLGQDFASAIARSRHYMLEAIGRHFVQALVGLVVSLALVIVGAIALLAVTTVVFAALGAALGAAIGALAGGAGALPGAAIGAEIGAELGFEIGIVLLEWLGLALLVAWAASTVWEIGSAFFTFLGSVWNARGDDKAIDQAARNFAEYIATLIAKIFELLVLIAAAYGTPWLIGKVGKTRFGQAIGESRLGKWIAERVEAVKGDGAGGEPPPEPPAGREAPEVATEPRVDTPAEAARPAVEEAAPPAARTRSAEELSQELSAIEDGLEALRAHPDTPRMLDAIDRAEALIREGELERAGELIDALNDRIRLAEYPAAEGGLEQGYGDVDPGRFVEYSPTEPSGGGTPVELDATAPRPEDATGQRLLAHVRDAIAEFEVEGFTEGQLRAQQQHPGLEAAHRGSRIDAFTKRAVLRDPELQHVELSWNYEKGADFLDSRTGRWYDITTTKAWKAHLLKYGNPPSVPDPARLPTEISPTKPTR